VNPLVSSRSGSGILKEDDIGSLRLFLAGGDGDGNDIVDPFGLQSTLCMGSSDRAGRREQGAGADEEESRLHHVRY
jgi:hypothetical protein